MRSEECRFKSTEPSLKRVPMVFFFYFFSVRYNQITWVYLTALTDPFTYPYQLSIGWSILRILHNDVERQSNLPQVFLLFIVFIKASRTYSTKTKSFYNAINVIRYFTNRTQDPRLFTVPYFSVWSVEIDRKFESAAIFVFHGEWAVLHSLQFLSRHDIQDGG